MQTITWNNLTIQTDYHPAMPTGSPPGIAPAYNQWNPANVQVVGGNLQLSLQRDSQTQWEGQYVWAAAEAVVLNPLSYGTYCCSFRIVDASGASAWSQFDTTTAAPNTSTTFGIFTYDPTGGGGANPNAELDLLELGFQNQPNDGTGWIGQQPGGPTLNNAQFAVQPWDAGNPGNPNWSMVRRLNIDIASIDAAGDVTILCQWAGAGQPVTYYLAYGQYTAATFPFSAASTISYTTPASINSYIPACTANVQLHLNLWPYGGPTTDAPVYCLVTGLQIP